MLVRRPSVFERQVTQYKRLARIRSKGIYATKPSTAEWRYIKVIATGVKYFKTDRLHAYDQFQELWTDYMAVTTFSRFHWNNFDVVICSKEETLEFQVIHALATEGQL